MTKTKVSLLEAIKRLGVVIESLFNTFPLFFFVSVSFVLITIYLFIQSEESMVIFLCFLVTIVSILIYAKTKNYTETSLSFLLGILTIYTIQWNSTRFYTFIFFYTGYNFWIFIYTSIRLAAQRESILKKAATLIDYRLIDNIYKELVKISDSKTNFQQLNLNDKTDSLYYFSAIKIPVNEMKDCLNEIEIIKTILQVNIETSLSFYKHFYWLKRNQHYSLDEILEGIINVPTLPQEVIEIIDQVKFVIVKKELDFIYLINKIKDLTIEGRSKEDIINIIKNDI